MFDFNPDTQANKNKIVVDVLDPTTASSEEILPFEAIDCGAVSKVRMKDGSSIVFMTFPGKNLALVSDRELESYADETSKMLSGINADEISIIWMPEKTDSNNQLTLIRKRVLDLQKETQSPGRSSNESFQHKKHIARLLTECILPQAERNALAAPTIQGRAYLCLKFKYIKDAEIENTVANCKKRIKSISGKESTVLNNEYEILSFFNAWVNATAYEPTLRASKIVLPKF